MVPASSGLGIPIPGSNYPEGEINMMPQPIILCIDDEKIILDSLETQLGDQFGDQFTIAIAESGEEGLEVIEDCLTKKIEVPVVITDYLMPGMKGDQFLIRLRQKLPDTRAVLLTGQAGFNEVITCINRANLYRYLAKPWEFSDLILTVKEAIISFQQHNTIKLQNAALQQLNKGLAEQVAVRTSELNRQKVLFQQVFNNSPEGMMIFNAESAILEVNPAFERILQFPFDDIKACRWPDIIVAPDWREGSTDIVDLALNGQTVRRELQFNTKSNKLIPVSLIAYPITTVNLEKAGIVVFHDLTEQRENENLLRRSYERRRRSNFFNELTASQKGIAPEAVTQAKLLGVDLQNSFLLMFLVVNAKKTSPNSTEQNEETNVQKLVDEIIDWLSLKPGVYSWGSQEGIGVICTIPENHQEDIENEKQLANNLLKLIMTDYPGLQTTLGLAEYHPQVERFAERYKQARLAALIGARIRPEVDIHHYWDIGAFPLLTRLVTDEEADRFLERTIRKLVRYDEERGTDLFPTLERIFLHESLRMVSDEMFIHYKTVLFRKQSIEKILGVSLDSFEGRLLIGTAMTLHFLQEMKYQP